MIAGSVLEHAMENFRPKQLRILYHSPMGVDSSFGLMSVACFTFRVDRLMMPTSTNCCEFSGMHPLTSKIACVFATACSPDLIEISNINLSRVSVSST